MKRTWPFNRVLRGGYAGMGYTSSFWLLHAGVLRISGSICQTSYSVWEAAGPNSDAADGTPPSLHEVCLGSAILAHTSSAPCRSLHGKALNTVSFYSLTQPVSLNKHMFVVFLMAM